MRRTIALALFALALPLVAKAAGGISVPMDQSRRLPINGQAANVVVGNTGIADVRAIDSRTLVVVGKKQGTTNVIVLDHAGRTLFDGEIVVSAGSGSMMTVFRGAEVVQYNCSPYCQSSTAAGENVTSTAAPGGMPYRVETTAPTTSAVP